MDPKRVLAVAERLARDSQVDALRLLVRQATLPLLAESMLAWTEDASIPQLLEEALPSTVRCALASTGAGVAKGQEIPVSMAVYTVVSFPWNENRMESILRVLAVYTWKYDPINHFAHYYRPIGVVFFFNGLHSAAAGILKRQGQFPAEERDLSPLYQAGLRIEWRPLRRGLFGWAPRKEVPFAVFGGVEDIIPYENHALLLALGEVLHRYGIVL